MQHLDEMQVHLSGGENGVCEVTSRGMTASRGRNSSVGDIAAGIAKCLVGITALLQVSGAESTKQELQVSYGTDMIIMEEEHRTALIKTMAYTLFIVVITLVLRVRLLTFFQCCMMRKRQCSDMGTQYSLRDAADGGGVKEEIRKELKNIYEGMTVDRLRDLMKKQGIRVSGSTKDAIVERAVNLRMLQIQGDPTITTLWS